jgi:hypothetical protein
MNNTIKTSPKNNKIKFVILDEKQEYCNNKENIDPQTGMHVNLISRLSPHKRESLRDITILYASMKPQIEQLAVVVDSRRTTTSNTVVRKKIKSFNRNFF